jgi:hypothetical protein
MAIILHERNGKTFLNKLKGDVAVSKATGQRLKNYATIALEWYVEAMHEATGAGVEVSTAVRSQEYWAKLRQKIEAKWKVYSLAKNVVEDALQKLQQFMQSIPLCGRSKRTSQVLSSRPAVETLKLERLLF